MNQLTITNRDISDSDPTRCGDCQHSDRRMAWCNLYSESCIGTPEDAGPELVRCPSCVAAPVLDGVTLDELRKVVGKP
jgi:hypothetical protein